MHCLSVEKEKYRHWPKIFLNNKKPIAAKGGTTGVVNTASLFTQLSVTMC
jgi:hypothetical protein